jgi:hypothetical protein
MRAYVHAWWSWNTVTYLVKENMLVLALSAGTACLSMQAGFLYRLYWKVKAHVINNPCGTCMSYIVASSQKVLHKRSNIALVHEASSDA